VLVMLLYIYIYIYIYIMLIGFLFEYVQIIFCISISPQYSYEMTVNFILLVFFKKKRLKKSVHILLYIEDYPICHF